ncbi:MAG: 50S ribosomal protein L15 [bacterium]
MRLGDLKPDQGAHRRRKRVGCGPGSGHGKTSCRGTKGAGQHSASEFDARFEGGQMPFYRRVGKRGFNSPMRVSYEVVNIGTIAGLGADRVTVELMRERRIIRRGRPVKVLGNGELDRAVTVVAHAFSSSAREKIEKAGGKAEVVA